MQNVHERVMQGSVDDVSRLAATLGSDRDLLWPGDAWPPMILDDGVHVGSAGGHDKIRYAVEDVSLDEPASKRWVTFRFHSSVHLDGVHRFEIEDAGSGRVCLRHVIDAQPTGAMRVFWPLAVRWLHDALIEDAFDGAELTLADAAPSRRCYGRWVRALRWMGKAAERTPESAGELQRRRVAADVTSAALAAAGAFHVLWAAGVTWPTADAESLARAVVGTTSFPSAAATLVVSALLGAAALSVQARVRPLGRLGAIPFPLADLGVRVVAATLFLRGSVGVVTSSIGVGNPTAPYRTLDLIVYSPLCLAMAWGAWRTVTGSTNRHLAPVTEISATAA